MVRQGGGAKGFKAGHSWSKTALLCTWQVDGQAIAVDLSQWVIQASEKLTEVGLTREARCLKVAFERVRQPRWHCQYIEVHPWTLLAALPSQGI